MKNSRDPMAAEQSIDSVVFPSTPETLKIADRICVIKDSMESLLICARVHAEQFVQGSDEEAVFALATDLSERRERYAALSAELAELEGQLNLHFHAQALFEGVTGDIDSIVERSREANATTAYVERAAGLIEE